MVNFHSHIISFNSVYRGMIPVLENHAINVCCRKEDAVELQELEAVAKLYYVIFGSRWMRGKVDLALSVGFKTMKICHTIRSVALKLSLLPTLIHILFIKCEYSEVALQLNELGIIFVSLITYYFFFYLVNILLTNLIKKKTHNRIYCQQRYR